MIQHSFLIAVKTNGAFVMQNFSASTIQAFALNAGESAIASDSLGKLWYLSNVGGTQTITDITSVINSKLDASEKGAANGVAPLGADGIVPGQYLPSYVDDVIDAYIVPGSTPLSAGWLAETQGGAALTPQSGKIYVILTSGTYSNKTYRWSGTTYVEISPSLVIGTTTGTAYDGGLGAALKMLVNQHIANLNNPHQVTAAQIGLGNVVNGAKPGIVLSFAANNWGGTTVPYTIDIPAASYQDKANGIALVFNGNLTAGKEKTASGWRLTSNIKQAIDVMII